MGTSEQPHIVAILPRGEAIRNFVYSGALDSVAEHARVSLLSVRPNEEIWRLLGSRYAGVFELPEIRERKLVWQLREILDMAHGRWLWSVAAQNRWLARDSEAISPAQRLTRTAKKLVCYPFASRPGLNLLSKVERSASRWLRTTDDASKMFKALKPSLVFNGSHVHGLGALPALQAAQWLGIPTATFLFSWDNLTSQGRLFTRYDHYLVWNNSIRDQLLEIYRDIRPEQVSVTGTPQFDFHFKENYYWTREEFCARIGADPRRPVVLYTTSMARPTVGEPRIVEGIARILREMKDLGPPQLLVRVYPKDRTGRFEELKQRLPDVLFPHVPWEPNWLTPELEDLYVFTNTLRHVAVGINAASTVSLELCMVGKPVINVAYNPPGVDISPFDYPRFYDFDHYRPVTNSGAITLARDESEMGDLIRDALNHPHARRQQQEALLRSMFGDTLDGASADRVARALLRLAGVAPDCATAVEGAHSSSSRSSRHSLKLSSRLIVDPAQTDS